MMGTDAKEIIKEIRRLNYKCSQWEDSFMESISRQIVLSPKQGMYLTKIYEKATGGSIYERRKVI